eukprot:TRINITY_DN2165_c0_g1_i2.p1 TRINITY_DN2165_c0_g1~~TRINITY_DN2165_c0_g1_i2.p1  ORF type:complete len:385 (-),score=48.81 TRINITY_DN2165_c0_g1_i2:156-1310(-)
MYLKLVLEEMITHNNIGMMSKIHMMPVHNTSNSKILPPMSVSHQPVPLTPSNPTAIPNTYTWPTAPQPTNPQPSHSESPEFEEYDSGRFCEDFLRSKGDSIISDITGNISCPEMFEEEMMPIMDHNGNSMWSPYEDDYHDRFPLVKQESDEQYIDYQNQSPPTHIPHASSPHQQRQIQPSTQSPSVPQQYSVVYGKRRGSCTICEGDCSVYLGAGGPCNECGCFPAQHIDLDRPNRKRARENVEEPPSKRAKYLMDTIYFRKLFFNSLQYMTMSELSNVSKSAPVPIFVKDEESVYIYMNPTFCSFIMDVTRSERIQNQNPIQLVGQVEGGDIVRQDQYLMSLQQGTAKTFDVNIKKQSLKVMKQWITLRDGQRVIVGAVVSSL